MLVGQENEQATSQLTNGHKIGFGLALGANSKKAYDAALSMTHPHTSLLSVQPNVGRGGRQ